MTAFALILVFAGAAAPATHPGPPTGADGVISIQVGDADRRAIVVNRPTDGSRRPAVIVLHGGMGNAEDMRSRSGFDPLARSKGFIAVYAEGTEFRDGMHAWNTGYLLRRQVRDADDIAYLDALIDRMVADQGADPARICMTGGSNGGMMTFSYAVRRPERLAAAAPVVASMFSFDRVPAVPLPILIINGAKDEEVPFAGGMSGNPLVRAGQSAPFKPVREVVDFWVKANGSTPEAVTSVDGTVTTVRHAAPGGGAVTEFVLDSAGGHGWPGTRARRDGNVPIGAFRGAERVWDFFSRQVRTPAAAPRATAIIEFPALVDPTRKPPGEHGPAAGRSVPIKVHLPAGDGPFPVVVVSHGAGGDWDTHFGQAQDLASHGYAVLCVEHVGSDRSRLRKLGTPLIEAVEAMTRDAGEVLGRPKDVTFAIDRAAEWNHAHERLKGKLDLERVAVMGHSFGAFTAMAACGMRPALDWLRPRVEPGKGLGPDLREPRVRCGVALSPQGIGEPFFLEESFAGLQVPLLGITGTKDGQQAGRSAEGRREAFAAWPGKGHVFVWLGNARHNDFTSSSGATGASLPSPTRDDVQPAVREATRAFLDLHLRGDSGATRRLSASALRPLLRGGIDGVDVLAR